LAKKATYNQPDYIYGYSSAGDFNVTLTVTNSDGYSDFSTVLIKNINEAPVIHFVSRCEPLKLILDAKLSQNESLSSLTFLWTIAGNKIEGNPLSIIFQIRGGGGK